MHRPCLSVAPCATIWAAWVLAGAALVLPLGCATVAPSGRDAAQSPRPDLAAAAPTPATGLTRLEDAQAMLAVARMAGTLQVPFAGQIIDQLVRWQHDLRDRLLEVKGRLQSPSSAPAVGQQDGRT